MLFPMTRRDDLFSQPAGSAETAGALLLTHFSGPRFGAGAAVRRTSETRPAAGWILEIIARFEL
jgi:hypothetical protein